MTHFGLHYLLPPTLEPAEVLPCLEAGMAQWKEGPTGTPLRCDLAEVAPQDHYLYEEVYRKVTSDRGETTDWPTYAAAHNQALGYKEGDEEYLHYDAETDSCYVMCDYNPDARFDYYRVGGRWSQYWPMKKEALGSTPRAKVWMKKEMPLMNGARLEIIDLEGMMRKAEERAERGYALFQQLTAGTPLLKTVEEVDHELIAEGALTPPSPSSSLEEQQAAVRTVTEAYWAQPALQRVRQAVLDGGDFLDPVDMIRAQRGGYESWKHTARMAVIPVYAHVDLEEQWHYCGTRGDPGPEELAAYNEATTEYITSLDPRTWIVTLDLHS